MQMVANQRYRRRRYAKGHINAALTFCAIAHPAPSDDGTCAYRRSAISGPKQPVRILLSSWATARYVALVRRTKQEIGALRSGQSQTSPCRMTPAVKVIDPVTVGRAWRSCSVASLGRGREGQNPPSLRKSRGATGLSFYRIHEMTSARCGRMSRYACRPLETGPQPIRHSRLRLDWLARRDVSTNKITLPI